VAFSRAAGADFLIWQRELGQSATAYSGADGDVSGVVDAADLALWRNSFATGAMSGATTSAPVPSSLLLAGVIVGGYRLTSLREERRRTARFGDSVRTRTRRVGVSSTPPPCCKTRA
jgi:hypothetical protein